MATGLMGQMQGWRALEHSEINILHTLHYKYIMASSVKWDSCKYIFGVWKGAKIAFYPSSPSDFFPQLAGERGTTAFLWEKAWIYWRAKMEGRKFRDGRSKWLLDLLKVRILLTTSKDNGLIG